MRKVLFAAIFITAGFCASAQNAVIDRVSGTVEMKHLNENTFKTANTGDAVFQDTVISTGFKSFAVILIGSTTITVRPLTLLTLTEIQKSAETETLNVNLQAGRVRVDVKPPAGTKANMTINSPTSTASVRGTSFEFDTSSLYVLEGTVDFSGNRGQNIFVRAGESSRAVQTGQVTAPIEERNANLLPPNPAGTGPQDSGSSGSPAVNGGTYSIQLVFE